MAERSHDDGDLIATLVDLGQYLGMAVLPSPHLPIGGWVFSDGGAIVVAHDIWERLKIPVFDAEMILPDEEICHPHEHGSD